jgi:hypothetical protein
MKIYKNIIQGTDEWKELRYRKVGGSTSEKVQANEGKPVENNAVFFQLLAEFTEEFEIDENEYIDANMARGNRLDPEAAELFANVYGKKLIEIGWAEINEFVGISPDRLIDEATENTKEALEIKCPAKNTYAKYLCVPQLILEDYVWQIVQYFVVFEKLEKLNFMVYRPENLIQNHILMPVTPDTIIQVSAKKVAPVRDLVIQAKQRFTELENAINNKIELLNQSKF